MKPRFVNDVAVLAPTGWLMGDKETDQVEAEIRKLLDSGNRRLVLDLSGVSHMNSTAIGMLVGCFMSYRNREGAIRLCQVDSRIQSVFVITKLVQVFDMYDSEREAIASFSTGAAPKA